jgi:phosphoribosylamine--glycine ligase
VLEFNCRFGDPETQVVATRLASDLLTLLASAAAGRLSDEPVAFADEAAVTVVMASAGYPGAVEPGVEIGGVEEAEALGAIVFHAATALRGDRLMSAGGRVLDVTALGATIDEARTLAYRAIDRIDFPGARYRRDIALSPHVSS